MKLTKSQLIKIIKEELSEAYGGAKGPFPDRYGQPASPRRFHRTEDEHPMHAADDELRELGDKISEMVVLSRQVEVLMLDMGMRYGELAALGTNARTAKQLIKELENIFDQKLDDIARFSKHGEGLDEKKLTKPETKEKERIVKGMKKDKKGFKKRYGDDAESVMYATATKQAKKRK